MNTNNDTVRKLTLQLWNGGHNLASINSDCLAVMAYVKLVSRCDSIDFEYISSPFSLSYNPFSAGFHSLPRLKISETQFILDENVFTERYVSGVFNILAEIRKTGSEDNQLDERQCADVLAFTSMIQRNLVPALNYLWWVDDTSYNSVTLPWFLSRLHFSIRGVWLASERNKHRQALSIVHSSDKNFNKEKIFENAAECLKILSDKLNGKEYFFNESPCTLDIVVYGCLALLEHVPFANELVNSYKGHHSLVAHCQRIDKCLKYLVVTPQSPKNNEVSTISGSFYKKLIVFGLFSLSAMTAYALTNGLIQIDFNDEDLDFNEFDDPETNEPPENADD